MTLLDADELARYARQIRLPQLGLEGQERLKRSSVLVVGAGGLGSPAAMYLAAAGVGRIGIADGDRVDASNLHRQLLHGHSDIGRPKVESAIETLRNINPNVDVEDIDVRLTSKNALAVVRNYDVVVDGTDNFPTRYLLNDACVIIGKPLVYGSVDRFEGQVSVFATENGPCYRCLFPEPPVPGAVQNCADAGVLGVLPGLIGTMQATEALKLLLGLGDSLAGRLLLADTLRMRFRTVAVERDPNCPACGTREITALIDYEAFCQRPAMPTPVIQQPAIRESVTVQTVTPHDLAGELFDANTITLIDVREPYEWAIARLDGAQLMPLGSFPAGARSLPRDANIVVYCHHGTRSDAAARMMMADGFTRVRNLVGGIDRWSVEVDPRVRRY